MTYLKINDTLYPATLRGWARDPEWDYRESLAVTVSMTYEEAVAIFTDDVVWGHVYQDENNTQEYDDSEYSVAGSITDNRNGTVTVKMGKITDGEALAELREVLGV